MSLFALVQNNTVVAVEILQDADIQAIGNHYQSIIDVTSYNPTPSVGMVCVDGVNFTGGTASTNWKITKLAFRERFTSAELVGIIAASSQANTIGYTIQMMLQNQMIATYIDLSRSDTAAGVGALVSMGLITSDRANTILTTIPTIAELYQGS